MSIPDRSVKALYPLALAEGEGVGTAYEYYVKRMALRRWLARRPPVTSLVVAGLPEKYGCSLDFLLLATDLGAKVTVVDDRPSALDRADDAVVAARRQGLLPNDPDYREVESLSNGPDAPADLVVSSEVLQRLAPPERLDYIRHWARPGRLLAIFAPNGDNTAHTEISGLNGITLKEMRSLVGPTALVNYIDVPPFPPGITRDEAQRERAQSGRSEAVAMRGLTFYARAERFFPGSFLRRHAHIVYAFLAP